MAVLFARHLRYDFAAPENTRQRPPRLLQGPRLAAALRALQGGGRDRRRGAAHLPRVRLPPAGPPDAGDPLGRRRHRLARPGPADLRRHRARRRPPRVLRPAGVGALRRLRAGRGVDVGGLRARRVRAPRQPVAVVDVNRLGQRGPTMHEWDTVLAGGARERLRLARAGDRRPRPRGDRRRLRPGAGGRPPRGDLRPHQEGLRASPPSRTSRTGTASRSPIPRPRSRSWAASARCSVDGPATAGRRSRSRSPAAPVERPRL